MAFNTGNAVPSSDAKDLSDNAENFDSAVNAQADTWQDRLLVTRDTVTGRLKKMGYSAPIVYAGGELFALNDNVKTVDESGVIYAPLPSALPFTTSGTFVGDDDARFFVVQGLTTSDADVLYVTPNLTPPNSTDSPLSYSSFNDYIGVLAGKMQAGETVTIACFGDSTTDGFRTTGWSANPVSGGQAVGNSDHNLTAPNAWPTKLEELLRDIYSNVNISTFNAGYDGRQLQDGWALGNYQAAVIDNPFYGVPDATIIQFGINDSQTGGSQLTDYVNQYRLLIRRIIDDGTVPILATTDPIWQNGLGTSTRSNLEIDRELNSAIRSLSEEFGVPILNQNNKLKDWIQDNTDGYSWGIEQFDSLHFTDNGHQVKSQNAAMVFFNDAMMYTGGTKYLNSFSSQVENISEFTNNFALSNNKQGGNSFIPSVVASSEVMTSWIYCKEPNGHLTYLGVDSEEIASGIAPSSIVVHDVIEGTSTSKDLINAGAARPTYRRSDQTFYHSKLKYGLNKVAYIAPLSGSLAFAGYGITECGVTPSGNVLSETGRFFNSYATSTGDHVDFIPEAENLSNTAGGFVGDTVSISFKVKMPAASGIIFQRAKFFDGGQAALTNNAICSFLLVRDKTTDVLRFFNLATDDVGTFAFLQVGADSPVLTLPAEIEGRVEISKAGGFQEINLYLDFFGGTPVHTVTATDATALPWGGIVGGTFHGSDQVPSAANVEIIEMQINR